jgi:hypothetical protein
VAVSVWYSTWEVAIVMPRSFSSGALSISSKLRAWPPVFSARTS